jgi:hypothetical protein
MEYLYTDQLNLSAQIAIEMLQVADLYGMDRLKLICEEYVQKAIELENACSFFDTGDRYNASHLRKVALNYILIHFEQLANTEDYISLPGKLKSEVEAIVRRNNLLRGV